MLIYAIRAYLALTSQAYRDTPGDELAHRVCETAVYAIVAPEAREDETTPGGEFVSRVACRADLPRDEW